MYVVIGRKPESGCEFQNSACGRSSSIIMRLQIVEELHTVEGPDNLPHGTCVLNLVLPRCR